MHHLNGICIAVVGEAVKGSGIIGGY